MADNPEGADIEQYAVVETIRSAAATLVAALCVVVSAAHARAEDRSTGVDAPHLRVELVSRTNAVRRGSQTTVGVVYRPEEHWHVYWVNPGETGAPPRVDLSAPGAELGAPSWPAPSRLEVSGLVSFVYEGEILVTATLDVPGAPGASPMICYEAIFPGRIDPRRRPGWLVNVTNDAWFGLTSGPYQHFASARLRAAEKDVPLVRAANTGITTVVDAHGRVQARLAIMTTGVLDAALPRATPHPTFYARLGDRVLLVLLLLALLVALAADMRHFALHNRHEQA